jgi:hypothetical protein
MVQQVTAEVIGSRKGLLAGFIVADEFLRLDTHVRIVSARPGGRVSKSEEQQSFGLISSEVEISGAELGEICRVCRTTLIRDRQIGILWYKLIKSASSPS